MSNNVFPFESALVTGASSGIGRALCVALCDAGVKRLVLVARSQQRLQELASSLSCETTVLRADLTAEDDIKKVLEAIEHIDLLVNNAGFGSFGPFHDQNVVREANMVHLNCTIPIRLSHRALG